MNRPVCALAFSVVFAAFGCTTEASPQSAPPPATEETPPSSEEAAPAPYPDGPYGTNVGQVLGDFDLVGYVKTEPKGLALNAGLKPAKLSDVRVQAGEIKYALIHVSAFWCGICRAAVEDLVAKYPSFASKAIFVDMLVEGDTPDDVATKPNLDTWVKELKVPYTALRDPDGVKFRIREKVGKNKTAVLVELSTMKILAKSATDYTTVLAKLQSLE